MTVEYVLKLLVEGLSNTYVPILGTLIVVLAALRDWNNSVRVASDTTFKQLQGIYEKVCARCTELDARVKLLETENDALRRQSTSRPTHTETDTHTESDSE